MKISLLQFVWIDSIYENIWLRKIYIIDYGYAVKNKCTQRRTVNHEIAFIKRMNILLIGTLPPPIGGVSVSFGVLVDQLIQRKDIDVEVLDLGILRKYGRIDVKKVPNFLKEMILKIKKVDVVTIYVASTAITTIGLMTMLLSRLNSKSFVLRKAAGYDYCQLGFIRGRIAHYVVKKSDLFLAETKNLVQLAQKRGIDHVKWYPTSRVMWEGSGGFELKDESCFKFVFVGQIRPYKGVLEIIEAAKRFKEGVIVDFYGPFYDGIDESLFLELHNIKYCGVLKPDNVIETLKKYDALLLPTKAKTEGYPGVIFEGYAAGLPIITTQCGGIPEIVDETSGIFVEPGDVDSLYHTMSVFLTDKILYESLRCGVVNKRKEFDSEVWADNFVDYCMQVKKKIYEY